LIISSFVIITSPYLLVNRMKNSMSLTNMAAPQTYINSLKSSFATKYTMMAARASTMKRIFSTFLILSGFIS
ncbi:hypothetical protein, partial [Bacteroides clarus]|uniref:hypothetical protein n=2 Tax=Bacteroides clarus TaxID=626929 RepID=UPI0026653DB3